MVAFHGYKITENIYSLISQKTVSEGIISTIVNQIHIRDGEIYEQVQKIAVSVPIQ